MENLEVKTKVMEDTFKKLDEKNKDILVLMAKGIELAEENCKKGE